MSIRVDFELDRGGFLLRIDTELPGHGFSAISGPSGSGKTTLLRAVAGLEPGVRGRICIDDDCWLDGGHTVPTHQRALGYVFQQAALFSHLDVKGNLRFGRERRGAPNRALAFDDVVDLLGIARLLERRIDGLSGGERQRVALGQALLSNPRLLLMDEPMASLDRAARQTLLPYLERLQRALAIPVLYVTHALDEVARLAGHMLLLQAGQVTASGAVGDLLTRLDLPMAHGREAGAVVPGAVILHDRVDRLSCVRFSGGDLWVPQVDLMPGTRVRLRILSRDISLSAPGDGAGSILNRVPVEVADVREAGPAEVIVRLRAGDETLLTRISGRARRELSIEPGARMQALIRSVATLV
ncbi:MAG: molybdenum ABC transporter ATP-binding protein [Gammaproteobacteria bacterium]|nr:molybdenum ABC transporter ATP-binding protein [Gammaproteobacteria bacterium]